MAMPFLLAILMLVTTTLAESTPARAGAHPSEDRQLRLTVLFDNPTSWRWTLFGVALLLAIAAGAATVVCQTCRLSGFGLG